MSVKHSTHETADDAAALAALPGFSAAEVAAMDAALAAALQGPRGANPLVGAVVIAADGTRLVTGYHRGAGTAHAEADAIDQAKAAGHDLSGTTMVVTLEPCNHCGRTGPCAQAIIEAGIADVVYAIDDPHDPAAGGAATLRAAGVRVRSGLGAEAALELNRRWFDAVAATTAVRHPAHRADPRQPDRRQRRHQPVDLQPGIARRQPRPARPDRRDPGRDPDGAGRQPAPHRPRRRRRTGRPAAAARRDGLPRDPRGRRDQRRRRQGPPPAHP